MLDEGAGETAAGSVPAGAVSAMSGTFGVAGGASLVSGAGVRSGAPAPVCVDVSVLGAGGVELFTAGAVAGGVSVPLVQRQIPKPSARTMTAAAAIAATGRVSTPCLGIAVS